MVLFINLKEHKNAKLFKFSQAGIETGVRRSE